MTILALDTNISGCYTCTIFKKISSEILLQVQKRHFDAQRQQLKKKKKRA
jgi:hypothetical protein